MRRISAAFGLLVSAISVLREQSKSAAAESSVTLANLMWSGLHGITSLKINCPNFPATPAHELTDHMMETLQRGLFEC